MARCCSFTASRDWCFRYSFSRTGLKSTTVNLHDGATVIHIWIPKSYKPNKPCLLLIHGFGANAMWQYNDFVSPLVSKFNVYIPDLLFFGDSYTTRPDRTEQFQAECVMAALEDVGVVGKNISVSVRIELEKLDVWFLNFRIEFAFDSNLVLNFESNSRL
ncbi:putative alpha/Beta hydrolase [Helianthus annuus]|nr:putative alpha/Beta hydrolase [Helianthus annuus]